MSVVDSASGCVPGPKGCLVKLSDAIKKPWPDLPANPPLIEVGAETFSIAA
jgi:hypothetical protein